MGIVPNNFRPIENWMHKGAAVALSGNRKGVLESFHTSTITEGKVTAVYIHSVVVRPQGCSKGQSYDPWNFQKA